MLTVLVSFCKLGQAQDIQFSQFYASSLFLNPAFAGIETAPTLNTNFRTQSRASENFLTTQISGIYPFIGGRDGATQNGGVGVSFFNDQVGSGSLTRTGFLAAGAYTIDMQLHKVAAGIQVGVVQVGLDMTKQEWGAGYRDYYGYNQSYSAAGADGGLANLTSSKGYLLTNIGLMYSYNPGRSYYSSGFGGHFGVSGYNLNQPNISLNSTKEYKLPSRVNVSAGLDFFLSKDIKFSPNVLFVSQAGFNQVNAGAYLSFAIVPDNGSFFSGTDLILGGWTRLQDAGIASFGLSNNKFTFGLSYDFNISQYNQFINNRGALEFSLAMHLVKEVKRKRFDTPRI